MPTDHDQTLPVVQAGSYTRISWDRERQRAGVERRRGRLHGALDRSLLGHRALLGGQRPVGVQRQGAVRLRGNAGGVEGGELDAPVTSSPSSLSPSMTSSPMGSRSPRHPQLQGIPRAGAGCRDEVSLARARADLGSAQSRLKTLDDDYYVVGALPLRRYRSIRTRLEREVERLHALVDGASPQRIVLDADPTRLWSGADFGQRGEMVERVDVTPARKGARFDPSRVKLAIPFASLAQEGTCLTTTGTS